MNTTIILPVHGISPWLKDAVESVICQESGNWKLIIADDGCDETAKNWLESNKNVSQEQRITWIKRPRNLGLFKNLNQAIVEADTEWVLLLCSDDILHKTAISSLQTLKQTWPLADLIISSFESINADGSVRPAESSEHHDQLRVDTGMVTPEQMIPELLRLGSLNGNLSGMAFSKEHWLKSGPFREDWRHAADWEWLIRASESKALLLNREPIVSVRTHEQQLSVRNRKSGHECQEVAAVVSSLLKHPSLKDKPRRREWAGHVMQYQLWNLLKSGSRADWGQWQAGIQAIHESAGIRQTIISLLRWLPVRIEKRYLTNDSQNSSSNHLKH